MTKHNICESIENFLKKKKIRFTISNQDSRGCLYEILISSTEGFIQVDYNLDDESNNYCSLTFHTVVNDNGMSLYHSDWDSESGDCFESEIECLVDNIKRIDQGLSKIQSKINQIKDLCENYGLEFEEMIEVIYNFD